MKLATPAGAVLFMMAIWTAPVCGQESLADVIERAEQSVVRIEVEGVDGESLGSGFVVDSQGTVVTNCHVLAGVARFIEVRLLHAD